MASRSRELGRHLTKSILYKLQLGPWGPDFKFELLPLHSPLLRQSLLVSFPPLIDMLKFSGYSYLIRGQTSESWGFNGVVTLRSMCEVVYYYAKEAAAGPPLYLGGGRALRLRPVPNTKQSLRVEMTLEQACPPEYWRAQCAFKDSMIH